MANVAPRSWRQRAGTLHVSMNHETRVETKAEVEKVDLAPIEQRLAVIEAALNDRSGDVRIDTIATATAQLAGRTDAIEQSFAEVAESVNRANMSMVDLLERLARIEAAMSALASEAAKKVAAAA